MHVLSHVESCTPAATAYDFEARKLIGLRPEDFRLLDEVLKRSMVHFIPKLQVICYRWNEMTPDSDSRFV